MSVPFLPIRMPGRAVVNGDAALLVRALDDDLGNAGLAARLEHVIANTDVLVQQLSILALVRIPA